MAIGASPRRALDMVWGEAMVLSGVGIAAGLLGALALTRVLAGWPRGLN